MPQSDSGDRLHALFQQALSCQRQGQVAQAEALYSQLLAEQPQHAGALHMSGVLALQQGAAQRACDFLRASIAAQPYQAAAHADLGNALQVLGNGPEALASYDRAIELQPGLLEAHFNRAVLLQQQQHLGEALSSYERVLELRPTLVVALYNRAVLLTQMQRAAEALEAYERCLEVEPGHAEALNNRGVVLLHLERPAQALQSFEASLRVSATAPTVYNNRGNSLRRLGRMSEALDSFEQSLALDPQFFEALLNRGAVLQALQSPQAALASLEAALQLRPDDANALLAKAQTLADLERHADATRVLVSLLRVAPAIDYAQGLRFYLQSIVCDWDGYEESARELVTAVVAGRRAIDPFPFLAVSDSAAAQARCARTYISDKHPAAPVPLWSGERYGHEKLRVAYVSGDFRTHATSALLAGVLESHDRERFQTLAVSLRPAEDSPLGRRVMAACDEFLDVSESSAAQIATLIREREIDILVDLMGLTVGSRPEIFARRPAPVQVNFLGFPGTSGAPYIDYILADEFLISPQARHLYTEKVAWLPDCFQPGDSRRDPAGAPPPRAELSLPPNAVVLCCFNNNYKLNPTCFDVWMRVLHAVPDSVLWLLADNEAVEGNLRAQARRRNVDPQRLIFASRVPYAEHLARLQCADLFLDTLPFNAGATASDALWAGLPLLTCSGEAFASRMAGSLLRAVGMPELVVNSLRDYESRAIELATTPALLADLRSRLARIRDTAPLFDSKRYCRHLESAYTAMAERSNSGAPPEDLTVSAS